MTVERYFVNNGHSHHFVVTDDVTGWDIREEEDSIVTRESHHHDWHRVERAVHRFERSAGTFERAASTEPGQP
jgi:hypothetical protein